MRAMISRDWHPKWLAKTLAALVVVSAMVALRPAPAAAQRAQQYCDVPPGDVREVWQVEGQAPPDFCRPPESGFRLFGVGDFAGTGMRLSDPNLHAFTTNTGFMDTGDYGSIACCTLPMYTGGTLVSPSGRIPQYFEVQFFEAVARGDWVRNRELAPSLQTVQGGGWTFIANLGRMSSIHMFQGRDGSAGLLHSGALSARNAGCRTHGGNFVGYPDGFPLLAGSDCPETWGAAGWTGRRPLNIEGWQNEFASKGDEFAFEFWRVNPDNYVPESERPFIGDFQTFGVMSDHGAEHIRRYGEVIPGQSGDPSLQGYAPGLDWVFNAYSFKIPTVAGMFIYEGLLINNSEDVYGVPLDYDSVYVGVEPRWLRGGDGRRAAIHPLPQLGAVVGNELGRTADCDGGDPVPTSVGCPSTRSTAGFRAGASGFMFLKTPIGDLRFKHFSDPTSPFYNPGHPLAGDTITYNRMSLCGFECTQTQFSSLDMRRGWGTIAAEPIAALGGRDPNLLSIREYWMLFKPEAGSDTRLDPANPRGPGGFNYYVPGDWQYTNKPPGAGTGPDTLWFDTCNPVTNDCTALWSDTLPDHTLNWAYNASWLGVGPFPLAAGDTAPFVVAAFAAPDSIRFMSLLDNMYSFYVNDFYLGPSVPLPPSIVSVSVKGGSRGFGEDSVTLLLGNEAASWRDPYALKVVEDIRAAEPGTEYGRLKELNPTLVDDLEALVNSNHVDRVYLFKSCNNGDTWTATGAGDRCPADYATDESGKVIGTGWEAYATLEPDDRGRYPSTFVDLQVTGGRSYLYSLVAETDGIDMMVDDSVDIDGDGAYDRVDRVLLSSVVTVLPPSRSGLLTGRDEPSVASVYVPVSAQAGAVAASAAFTSERGPVATSSGLVSVQITAPIDVAASYDVVFGDSVRVYDYYSAEGTIDSSTVVLYRSARTGFDENGDPIYVPFAQNAFRSTSPDGVVIAANAGELEVEETPDITTQRLIATAGVVAEHGTAVPLFVSSVLTGTAFTPSDVFSRPEFGGFVVSATNSPGEKLDEYWALEGEELRSASWPSLEWLDGDADATGDAYGFLTVDWVGDAFASTVRVDQENPANTQTAYEAAVTGRSETSSSVTDQASIDLIADALGLAPEDVTLASVSLPFTITDATANAGAGREVSVAVLEDDLLAEALLGTGADTMTVQVPAGHWIPGVRLILIEDVEIAQSSNGDVSTGSDGEPQITTTPRVIWTSAVLGCGNRSTCNPVTGPGQDGYVSIRNGMTLAVEYAAGLTGESRYEFNLTPARTGNDIDRLSGNSLDDVKVVPNPYIFYSVYEQESGTRRIMFTNLPPEGRIRIYTAAGQFVQQMEWGPEDLMGNGDLFYNMRTVEDNEMAAGVYLYLVEATGENGGNAKKLGKFIIIR
ncbi:MAG: hypothetical protein PVI01_05870 [Gemmatimonadales bacterium]